MSKNCKGVKELFEEVIYQGFCTGCGACITGCPYIVTHEGRIILLDKCTVVEAECYEHCPRTYTDMNALSHEIFGVPFSDQEVGVTLDIYMARTKEREIGEKGQDGGTVTTLLALALQEGMIDLVVCTKMDEDKVPRGYLARSREELLQCAGTCYEASFALESYRSIPRHSTEKVGVVGLGCQLEALTKIRQYPPEKNVSPDNIKLTLGLFCGWALSPHVFHPYLRENYDVSRVVKFDIPHTPGYSFDVHTKSGIKSVPLDEIRPYINPACQYCWDMTAEFSDVSLGSAGSAFPGWNTVVTRTKVGADLMELVKRKGLLETQALPDGRLAHLKSVALKRKKEALKSIVGKTGNKNDLLYVGNLPQRMADRLLEIP